VEPGSISNATNDPVTMDDTPTEATGEPVLWRETWDLWRATRS